MKITDQMKEEAEPFDGTVLGLAITSVCDLGGALWEKHEHEVREALNGVRMGVYVCLKEQVSREQLSYITREALDSLLKLTR